MRSLLIHYTFRRLNKIKLANKNNKNNKIMSNNLTNRVKHMFSPVLLIFALRDYKNILIPDCTDSCFLLCKILSGHGRNKKWLTRYPVCILTFPTYSTNFLNMPLMKEIFKSNKSIWSYYKSQPGKCQTGLNMSPTMLNNRNVSKN